MNIQSVVNFFRSAMSEAEIPIDIAVRKLLDWLVSRRIVNRNWHEGVTSIRCVRVMIRLTPVIIFVSGKRLARLLVTCLSMRESNSF